MTDYVYTLTNVHPEKKWSMVGDDYEGIQWLDGMVIPKSQLDAEYISHKNQFDYREKRLAAYPPIQEQLEMIYDLGIDGWKVEMKKVKDRFPKPNQE